MKFLSTGFVILLFALFSSISSAAQNADSLKSMRYLQNAQIKVGIDLNLGGAITYISKATDNINLINNVDWGRQVQMSFYSGPVPFEPEGKKANPSWTFIGWNPIQSGDVAGNRSKVLGYKNNGREMYVKCIPMHWPLDNVPGECTYECWIKLDGSAIKVRSRMLNNRPDTTQYPARGQELPAVYTNAPWHRLITYRGDKPYTNDTTSLVKNHNFPGTPEIRWAHWQATENWAANLDDKDYGLGVWNDGIESYSGGYFGDSLFVGGSKSVHTAYIAPNSNDVLDCNIDYDYNYALILGSLTDIRKYVYSHRKKQSLNFNFKNSRLLWYYDKTTDSGWPIKNGLKINLQKDAALISPLLFWRAADAKSVVIEAAYTGGTKKARLYFRGFGERGFDESEGIDFDVIPDGKFHKYTIRMQNAKGYNGVITGLKILLTADAQAATSREKSGLGKVTVRSIVVKK